MVTQMSRKAETTRAILGVISPLKEKTRKQQILQKRLSQQERRKNVPVFVF